MGFYHGRRCDPSLSTGQYRPGLRSGRQHRSTRPRVFNGRRLRLEILEDRCVLSVATVTTPLDVVDLTDGKTSLREALFFTNVLAGHDTIQFDPLLNGETISLSLGELTISDSLTINGAGLITISAVGSDPTPDVNNGDGSRAFRIDDGNDLTAINVTLSGLRLSDGDTVGSGGAVLSREALTLENCVVTDSAAADEGGGVTSLFGSLSIVGSTISGNSAPNAGGVLSLGQSASIVGSTFSGNSAAGDGGGLFSSNDTLSITNSTFSDNSAANSGGGLVVQPRPSGTTQIQHSTIANNNAAGGAGLSVSLESATLDHTIVAGNTRSGGIRDDVSGTVVARYSLIGVSTGASITDSGGNQIGIATAPINALLGPLANNGGPTFTHTLLSNSPAIDAGDPAAIGGVNVPATDQRGSGFGRVENGKDTGARIDIGAYEVQSGSIRGFKWNDLDGDGHWEQPEEPGLPGWIVFIDANLNSSLDGGEVWTVTDSNGAYSFGQLAPGNYTIGEVMQPGWTQTEPGGPETTNLIVNGGFETGNFTGWTAGVGFVINTGITDPPSPDGPMSPYSGQDSALFASTGARDLYQTVTIPTGGPYTLHWAQRIRNHSTLFDANQQVRVEIRNTDNQVLTTLFSTQSGDVLLQNWVEKGADISAFAGQTVRIAFVVVANRTYLNLHVDDVRITRGNEVGEIPIALAAGQDVAGANFGNWVMPTGEIHGFKWNDLNGNGVWEQPAEPGIGGWTIYLDANQNGGLDADEAWTTTAADGSYSFIGLPAGEYLISELLLPGWVQTSPSQVSPPVIVNGGFEAGNFTGWTLQPSTSFVVANSSLDPPGSDLPASPYQGGFSALSYNSSTNVMYQDVAIPANSHFTLHWADRIRNFGQSFSDPTQEYRVEIRNTTNGVLGTAYSTTAGDPLLQEWTERSADLSAYAGQTIRVVFSKIANLGQFNVLVDSVRITNDLPVAPIFVTLDPGEVVNAVNFGNRMSTLAEIHGYKWNDLNGNGQWDQPTEPPLAGMIVYMDSNANGVLEFGEPFSTTGADGSYVFAELAAGNYVVSEVVPPGWTQTSPGNDILELGPERLFVTRGVGTTLMIHELNWITGASIHSFTAPATLTAPGQGLALGPHSLFFIEGNSSTLAHTLWELDPDTGAVIDADVIDAPNSGAIDGLAYLDGKIYLQKPSTNQILVWNPATDTTVATFTVGIDLIGSLTGAADLGVLFAVNSVGTVVRIDPNTGTVLSALPSVESFAGVGLAYIDGKLIAVRSGTTGQAFQIDPVTGARIGTMTLGGTGTVGALGGDGANFLSAQGARLVTLATNEIVNNVNFGNWIAPPGEIHGFKWNDLDGDGTWDQPQEPALANLLIFLDTNTNGLLDNGERWTATAADGSYSFTGLPAGEYFVAELMQPGWTASYPNEVHHDFERLFEVRGTGAAATIYELDPATGIATNAFTAPLTLTVGPQGLAVGPRSLFYIDGSNSSTHTLYELNPDTGAVIDSDVVDATLLGTVDGLAYLNGKVYIQKPSLDRILVWDPVADTLVTTLMVSADLSGGLTGAADLGLLFSTRSNGNIFAIHPATGAIYATYTPATGATTGLGYVRGQLIGVRSGTTGASYRIDPLTGSLLGTFTSGGVGTAGSLGGDGAVSVSRETHVVDVSPGQSVTNINFGNWIAPAAEIHGFAWNDLDNDGIWDQPNEPATPGWTIFLDVNGNGVLDPTETSTTTAADGSYSFTGLAPGPHNIAEVLQTNWARTFTLPFIVLDAGESAPNINFGNHALPGSIAGQKWNDLDGDGLKGESEPGLAGWTIYIDQNGNSALDDGERFTTTGFDGVYSFASVEVGSYNIREVQQSGWAATYTPPGVVITPALNVTGVNFGNKALPGTIRGEKFIDLDRDGTKDPDEPGAEGWTIYIDSNENGTLDNGEYSVITDATGHYEIPVNQPGEYLVAEVQRPGWKATTPTTFVLSRLLSQLNANNSAISALVPNRYDFLEGETGYSIVDGGNNMYDEGNSIIAAGNTTAYTNGVISSTGNEFGAGSEYFTAKYPGLFVLAASDTSWGSLQIYGGTGADGNGSVELQTLSTMVEGLPYTILLKRVYGAGTPSINHLIIVPGDNPGISHHDDSSTDSDFHVATGLPTGEIYYLLVSSANGGLINNTDVLNIGNEFLSNVAVATYEGALRVTVGPGQTVTGIDIGNSPVPRLSGDYNLDNSVDSADVVLWRNMLGETVLPYAGADGDGDGVVDQDDHAIWRAHFGEVLAPAEAAGGTETADHEMQLAAQFDLVEQATSDPIVETAPIDWDAVPLRSVEGSLAHVAAGWSLFATSEGRLRSHSPEYRSAKADDLNHQRAQDEGLVAWLMQRRPMARRDFRDIDVSAIRESATPEQESGAYGMAIEAAAKIHHKVVSHKLNDIKPMSGLTTSW